MKDGVAEKMVPVHNEEVERCFLCLVMNSPEFLERVDPEPGWFYVPAHKVLAEAVIDGCCFGEAERLGEWLQKRGVFEAVGGAPGLATVAAADVSALHGNTALERVEWGANYLADLAVRRLQGEKQVAEGDTQMILERVFYTGKNAYLWQTRKGFIELNERALVRHLANAEITGKRVDEVLVLVEGSNFMPKSRIFDSVPGCRAGVYRDGGGRYVVRRDYVFPYPEGKQGDCSTILALLRGLFDEEQMAYFLAWVQGARIRIKASLAGREIVTASQVLAIVGEAALGKTALLTDRLLVPLLGGDSVPYGKMLAGKSDFNGELLKGCLLLSDDTPAPKRADGRKRMASIQKQIGYEKGVSVEAKGATPVKIRAPWCQVCLANLDEQSLGGVPDFRGSEDKFIGLYATRRPDFPPNDTAEEKKELNRRIRAELAAFAWYVDHYSAPVTIQDPRHRHSCREFIHPDLLVLLMPLSDEGKLMAAIDRYSRAGTVNAEKMCKAEGLTAGELLAMLESHYSTEGAVKGLSVVQLGRMMKVLCERFPDVFSMRTGGGRRVFYRITPSDMRKE